MKKFNFPFKNLSLFLMLLLVMVKCSGRRQLHDSKTPWVTWTKVGFPLPSNEQKIVLKILVTYSEVKITFCFPPSTEPGTTWLQGGNVHSDSRKTTCGEKIQAGSYKSGNTVASIIYRTVFHIYIEYIGSVLPCYGGFRSF